MMFTVYSGTDCPNCDTVKDWMKANELKFEEFNVREDAHALNFLKGKGHGSIPQVYLNGKHVTGIKDFKKNIAEAINGGG